MTHFEMYKDRAGEWRWRLRAKNGRIIATSSEGYEDSIDCFIALGLVKKTNDDTFVELLGEATGLGLPCGT